MNFNKWFDTFLSEKELDETDFIIEKDGFTHILEWDVLISFIKSLSMQEKEKIKEKIVYIDFRNGDICHFFEYLAKGYIDLVTT